MLNITLPGRLNVDQKYNPQHRGARATFTESKRWSSLDWLLNLTIRWIRSPCCQCLGEGPGIRPQQNPTGYLLFLFGFQNMLSRFVTASPYRNDWPIGHSFNKLCFRHKRHIIELASEHLFQTKIGYQPPFTHFQSPHFVFFLEVGPPEPSFNYGIEDKIDTDPSLPEANVIIQMVNTCKCTD